MDYLATMLNLAGISRAEFEAAKLSPAMASRLAFRLAEGMAGAFHITLAELVAAQRDPVLARQLWSRVITEGEGWVHDLLSVGVAGAAQRLRDRVERPRVGPGSAPDPAARRDPYTVLGVDRTNSSEFISAVYHRKVKANHPDKGGDPRKLQAIVDAMRQIRADRAGDPELR